MVNNAELINDISQLLPTVFIEQISLDSVTNSQQDNKNLLVGVTLSLKDVVNKDGISQWFAEQDLQKYIKVHCLLITSESVFNNFYNLPSNYGYDELKFAFSDNQFVTEKTLIIPSQKDLKQKKGVFYSENYITDNDDGTKEITVPIKTSYVLSFNEQQDSFLAVLCFLTFNLKEFASAFDITGIDEQNALSRSFTNQIIFKDKKLVSENQYFILPNGDYYYGQFHIINDNGTPQYKTGTVETEQSQVLQLVTDSNNIISDFRVRKYFADKETFDETGNINKVFKDDLQIKKIIDKTKNNKKVYSKYFSDIFVSLDEQGNCRFSFFFDKQKFALDNSFYPVVLDPEKNPNAIPELVRVKNISIYRIRKDIKEINLTSENNSVLIASNSSTKEGFDVLNKPNTTNSYVIENNVDGVNPAILKNYSVCDVEVSKINYGLYKYKIAMEIVDPTKSYLSDALNKAKIILNFFQEYYALSLSNKKIIATIPNTTQQEAKYIPYFDNLLGKFISDFSTDYAEQLTVTQQQLLNFLYLAKSLGYYTFKTFEEEQDMADSIKNLLLPPAATPDSIQVVIKLVEDFSKKVETILQISDSEKPSNLASKYKNNIISFEHTFENSATNELGNMTVYDSSKIYDSYFNAAIINGAGYKVIDNLSKSALGINCIELADYKKLSDKNSQKYFNDSTSFNLKDLYEDKIQNVFNFVDDFENDNSKYSFLSLSSVGTINKKYDFYKLSEQFYDQNFYESLFLDIINYNTAKLSKFDKQDINKNSNVTNNEQILKAQLLDLFSFSELSSVSFSEYNLFLDLLNKKSLNLFNIFGNSNKSDDISKIDTQVTNIQDSSITSQAEINSDPVSLLLEMLLHEIVNNDEDLKKVRDFSIFNPLDAEQNKNADFFLDKIVGLSYLASLLSNAQSFQTIVSDYFRNLPIPLKHLVVSRGNTTNIVKAYTDSNDIKDASIYPENFFKYWVNFKKIYEIQYFDGFENNNIKFPKWKTLTISKLNASQTNILCRMKKYTLDGFEQYFQNISKLEMPLFDQYFYIIPDKAVNLLTNIQFSIKNVPKVTLPPVQLANPPPNKIGPISRISINNAVNAALSPSLAINKVETLNALVSTVAPIPLQTKTTSLVATSTIPAPSIKISVDTAPALQTLSVKNAPLPTAPSSVVSGVNTVQDTQKQTVVSVNTAKELASISIQNQNKAVSMDAPQPTGAKTTPPAPPININVYKKAIAKIKI